jgi:hypothetical protein
MTMLTVTALAPAAPGRIGQSIAAADLLRYLDALGGWRDQRRRELDALDAAALAAPDAATYTGDVTLSMALWQAVADRHDAMLKVWDGGRVGPAERERLSTLIWGRVGGGLAVSVPEACRLSDALAGQLRTRLSLDPAAADVASLVRALRAQVERIRDLVAAEPPGPGREGAASALRRLDTRLADVSAGAARGADVTGFVATLEHDAAKTERDLIVGAATRRDDERDLRRAHEMRAGLVQQGLAAREVAKRCVDAVWPAPRFAVPDVTALGPVPDSPAAVDAYLARLKQVSRAIAMALSAYTAALAEREELAGRLEAYRAKAEAVGTSGRPGAAPLLAAARAAVSATPTQMEDLRRLVDAYTRLVSTGGVGPGGVGPGGVGRGGTR